jgi:murein L,D-transpeptidase YafK
MRLRAIGFVVLFLPGWCAHAGTTPEKRPDARSRPALEFAPTQRQADRPRVKAARSRRLGDIAQLFGQAGLDYPPRQVLLRGFKNEDVLELWVQPRSDKRFVHLKDYAICMRSGQSGPKRARGDMQVPEGFYQVISFNPQSDFLLSMLIDYPNRSDRIRKQGRDAGGSICIHGSCVTIGCIPLTDRYIEELYVICLDTIDRFKRPVLVHLFPGRLDEAGMDKLTKENVGRTDLLDFWRELKTGYDRFERDQAPARFSIDEKGRYRFNDR